MQVEADAAMVTTPADEPAPNVAPRGRLARLAGFLVRSRVTQFVVLGGLLFAVAPPVHDPYTVDLRGELLDAAVLQETSRLGGRALPPEELARVRSRAIEDAVLVREARRLGLDQGDGIVRQRLVQKMLFLAEDLGGAARPSNDGDLRAFYETHQELYRVPTRVDFIHVFGREEATLRALQSDVAAFDDAHPDDIPPLGDPFPQRRRMGVRLGDLVASWGQAFADDVAKLAPGVWSEPVSSRYGFHLVKVVDRRDEGTAPYAEVRDRVKLDRLVSRREAAVAQHIDGLLKRYRVTVDQEPVRGYVPSKRTAVHTAPSAED